MPSVHGHGHNRFIMEKHKAVNSGASGQSPGESSTFICTECGDGFSQYSNVLAHMAIHGPLESFSFDGSSNGFEIPREYVLQENGTLTVVNGFLQSHSLNSSHSSVKPGSPGVLPSHLPSPFKSVSPTPRPQSSSYSDVFRLRASDLNLDKPRKGHYRCEICNRSFNSLQSLHRHQQYRNTERGYKCTLCCKIFEDRQDLKNHLQDHISEKFNTCSHCGKRFLKVEALNAHRKEFHSGVSDKPENPQERKLEKTYTCKKCKLCFFWMSDFQTHSLFHCKGKELDPVCLSESDTEVNSKNYEDSRTGNCYINGSSIDLKNGNRKFSRDSSSEYGSVPTFTPYRCGLCGDRFENLTALKEHHLTHQTQEEIDELNQESQKALKRKMQTKRRRRGGNPNGKLHPCKHCHRVFNHSSSLSRHMRYHKGTMHTCVFCGRHFPQRCDLRRHLAMYHKTEMEKKPGLKLLNTPPQNGPSSVSVEGEKDDQNSPDETIKGSSDNEQLSSSDQSPKEKQSGKAGRVNYKCEECGKTFGLLCVYQRHLRYHKKEPSKCPRCPAEFKNASSLELHLQNHPSIEHGHEDGQTSHATGTNADQAIDKDNIDDIEDDYKKNEKGSSSEVLYECTECTETFTCLDTFLQHQASHSSENND